MVKGTIKHKVGWCSFCGFVHEMVRPYSMVENGKLVLRPICPTCRKKERERERIVICAVCGETKGDNLFPTTVERLTFDEVNTCNFIIPLCKECKQKPHSEIREQLNAQITAICNSCIDRFKCFTVAHEEAPESRVFEQDPQKLQRNVKLERRFWR